jgi:hypothetical protein
MFAFEQILHWTNSNVQQLLFKTCIDINLINLNFGVTSATLTADNFPCGGDADCWDACRWNVLSQTYTAQSSQHATCAICCHTYHTISERPFGYITLIGYMSLKYLKVNEWENYPVWPSWWKWCLYHFGK